MLRLHRREGLALLAIIVASLCLKAVVLVCFHHAPESDELAYESMGLSIVHHGEIVDVAGNRAMYNVGYPLFVLAPAFFVFGDGLLSVRIINALLGCITVAMTFWVAAEAGAGRIGRLAAAAAWGFYLPASVYVVYLNKENLLTPLMLGVIACALRLLRNPRWSVAIVLGALFGSIALTGNAGLSLAAAVGAALLLMESSGRQKILLCATSVVVALIVVAPWMARNARVLGAPVLNTNGGFNLYLGNNPAATGAFVSIGDTPRDPTWGTLRKLGEVQASNVLRQDAIEWIREHPAAFARLAVSKAQQFWSLPLHEGKETGSSLEFVTRLIWILQYVALVVAALASVALRELRNRRILVVWLAVAGYTSVFMLFYVSTRYREPIMPLVCVLAAMLVEQVYRRRIGVTNARALLTPRLVDP